MYPLSPDVKTDIPYSDDEITRDIGEINHDFVTALQSGDDILSRSIAIARANGSISVLDAGCGIGHGLSTLKSQIGFRAGLSSDMITMTGVSLSEHTHQLDEEAKWQYARALKDKTIKRVIGNLAVMDFPRESFDVVYSYQVLVHNEDPSAIIQSILPSLKPEGVFFFDSSLEQQEEIAELTAWLPNEQWDVAAKEISRRFYDGSEGSKVVHRVKRTDS